MRKKRGKDYPADKTFLQAKVARSLAQTYGTPLFIYDRRTLEAQVARVDGAFSWNTGHRGVFPVRQLHNPAVLRIIHGAGCRLLCCNAVELRLAHMAGVPGEDTMFSAFFPDGESLEMALSLGATIILDSGEQLEDIPLHIYGQRVLGLRLTEEELRQWQWQSSGRNHTKLGMSAPELMATVRRALARGFRRFGLSIVSGEMGYATNTLANMTEHLLSIARNLRRELDVQVEWCCIGGDIPWPTTPERITTTIEREAEAVRERYMTSMADGDGQDVPLLTQVGAYLTMPAGVFLTRCLGIKRGSITYVGTDTSCTHLPSAVGTGIHYHVSKVGNHQLEGRETVHLVGLQQERRDGLTKMQCLPPLRTGDLLLIHDTGAYGRSASGNYGGILRCPEVLLDDSGPRLIARRETFADYIACLQGDQQEHQENQHHSTQPQGHGHIQKPGDGLG